MAAAAYQKAPETKKPETKKYAGAQGSPDKQKESKGMKQKLHDLPRAAGIAIMALLLIASLFVGNFRALQGATPGAFIRQGDVKSIIEDRIDAAGNAMTVARRAALEETIYQGVDNAVNALEDAKSARDISRADQALTAAVSVMIDDASGKLDGESRTMLTRAADDFAEQGSFLRQEARSYNEDAKKAEALYEKLPTKFILAQPDVYEGI